MKFSYLDFAKGLKTLVGVLGLSIPHLDGNLIIGTYTFNIPDVYVSLLVTPEIVAIFTGLIVYGFGMKIVNFIKLIYPKK